MHHSLYSSLHPLISFTLLQLACLSDTDTKQQLLQWSLNETLSVSKFRFTGAFDASADYDRFLKDFVRNENCMSALGCTGTPATPVSLTCTELSTSVQSMTFFDRLNDNDITHGGHIRGCFDETFHGLTIGDKLREMLINEDSENAFVYSETEKKELIYVLFRLLAIGGGMCQPDVNIERYLELTKGLYRDLLTVYKAPATGEVTVSGRVFLVEAVKGVSLHPEEDKPFNTLVMVIEPLRKEVRVLKCDYKSFW